LHGKDYNMIMWAAIKSEILSRRINGWNSVDEIRKWREIRK